MVNFDVVGKVPFRVLLLLLLSYCVLNVDAGVAKVPW
jgi:hypothetical protein